jgi:alpha-methylacyl-CoA racemase
LAQYYGAFNISAKDNGFLRNPLGKNLLDGGAPFYSLYPCKGGTLAVGNLEPKFYQEMVKGLKLEK